MTRWIYFPRSDDAPQLARQVVSCFEAAHHEIDSERHELESNAVLAKLALPLTNLGFAVETGKRRAEKLSVPVLYGLQGHPEKSFEVDAYHALAGFVVEVEAGRGVVNNQFLKDLFQACMMHDVRHLCIAVRKVYRRSKDFDKVRVFMDTLYSSGRLRLPLEGILIVGY